MSVEHAVTATGNVNAGAMAVNAAGETVVVGDYYGELTIGDVVLPSADSTMSYAAKYDSELELLWARQLPTPATMVAFGADGDVTTGWLLGILRLDGETGDVLWSVDSYAFDIAVLTDGDAIAVHSVILGGTNTRYDAADGSVVWETHPVEPPSTAVPHAVAAVDGGFYWLGDIDGSIETQQGQVDASALHEPMVIRFDDDGVAQWASVVPLGESGNNLDLAVDDCGVYVGGARWEWEGRVQYEHAFLLRMDAAGELLWLSELELEDMESHVASISANADGDVLLAGRGDGSIAGQQLGYDGGFASQLNRDGDMLWAQTFGSIGSTPASGVGYLPTGEVRVFAYSVNSNLTIAGTPILDETGIVVADLALAPR